MGETLRYYLCNMSEFIIFILYFFTALFYLYKIEKKLSVINFVFIFTFTSILSCNFYSFSTNKPVSIIVSTNYFRILLILLILFFLFIKRCKFKEYHFFYAFVIGGVIDITFYHHFNENIFSAIINPDYHDKITFLNFLFIFCPFTLLVYFILDIRFIREWFLSLSFSVGVYFLLTKFFLVTKFDFYNFLYFYPTVSIFVYLSLKYKRIKE